MSAQKLLATQWLQPGAPLDVKTRHQGWQPGRVLSIEPAGASTPPVPGPRTAVDGAPSEVSTAQGPGHEHVLPAYFIGWPYGAVTVRTEPSDGHASQMYRIDPRAPRQAGWLDQLGSHTGPAHALEQAAHDARRRSHETGHEHAQKASIGYPALPPMLPPAPLAAMAVGGPQAGQAPGAFTAEMQTAQPQFQQEAIKGMAVIQGRQAPDTTMLSMAPRPTPGGVSTTTTAKVASSQALSAMAEPVQTPTALVAAGMASGPGMAPTAVAQPLTGRRPPPPPPPKPARPRSLLQRLFAGLTRGRPQGQQEDGGTYAGAGAVGGLPGPPPARGAMGAPVYRGTIPEAAAEEGGPSSDGDRSPAVPPGAALAGITTTTTGGSTLTPLRVRRYTTPEDEGLEGGIRTPVATGRRNLISQGLILRTPSPIGRRRNRAARFVRAGEAVDVLYHAEGLPGLMPPEDGTTADAMTGLSSFGQFGTIGATGQGQDYPGTYTAFPSLGAASGPGQASATVGAGSSFGAAGQKRRAGKGCASAWLPARVAEIRGDLVRVQVYIPPAGIAQTTRTVAGWLVRFQNPTPVSPTEAKAIESQAALADDKDMTEKASADDASSKGTGMKHGHSALSGLRALLAPKGGRKSSAPHLEELWLHVQEVPLRLSRPAGMRSGVSGDDLVTLWPVEPEEALETRPPSGKVPIPAGKEKAGHKAGGSTPSSPAASTSSRGRPSLPQRFWAGHEGVREQARADMHARTRGSAYTDILATPMAAAAGAPGHVERSRPEWKGAGSVTGPMRAGTPRFGSRTPGVVGSVGTTTKGYGIVAAANVPGDFLASLRPGIEVDVQVEEPVEEVDVPLLGLPALPHGTGRGNSTSTELGRAQLQALGQPQGQPPKLGALTGGGGSVTSSTDSHATGGSAGLGTGTGQGTGQGMSGLISHLTSDSRSGSFHGTATPPVQQTAPAGGAGGPAPGHAPALGAAGHLPGSSSGSLPGSGSLGVASTAPAMIGGIRNVWRHAIVTRLHTDLELLVGIKSEDRIGRHGFPVLPALVAVDVLMTHNGGCETISIASGRLAPAGTHTGPAAGAECLAPSGPSILAPGQQVDVVSLQPLSPTAERAPVAASGRGMRAEWRRGTVVELSGDYVVIQYSPPPVSPEEGSVSPPGLQLQHGALATGTGPVLHVPPIPVDEGPMHVRTDTKTSDVRIRRSFHVERINLKTDSYRLRPVLDTSALPPAPAIVGAAAVAEAAAMGGQAAQTLLQRAGQRIASLDGREAEGGDPSPGPGPGPSISLSPELPPGLARLPALTILPQKSVECIGIQQQLTQRTLDINMPTDCNADDILRWSADEVSFVDGLRQEQWALHRMLGDGNCLFRALAHQLWLDPSRHGQVRSMIVSYMRANPDFFEPVALAFGVSLGVYTARMSVDGEWGGYAELLAIEEIADRPVAILHSEDYLLKGSLQPRGVHFSGEFPPVLESAILGLPPPPPSWSALGQGRSEHSGGIAGAALASIGLGRARPRSTSTPYITPIRLSYHGASHYNSISPCGARLEVLLHAGLPATDPVQPALDIRGTDIIRKGRIARLGGEGHARDVSASSLTRAAAETAARERTEEVVRRHIRYATAASVDAARALHARSQSLLGGASCGHGMGLSAIAAEAVGLDTAGQDSAGAAGAARAARTGGSSAGTTGPYGRGPGAAARAQNAALGRPGSFFPKPSDGVRDESHRAAQAAAR